MAQDGIGNSTAAPGDGKTLREVAVYEHDGEPRALDTEIADRLGMARATNIRSLIEANRSELETFGSLHAARAEIRAGKGAKRPGSAFYLNEEQALLISAISKAPNAPAVRAMLIRTFVAWRRGHLEAPQVSKREFGGIAKGVITKAIGDLMPGLLRTGVEAILAEKRAAPTLDFAETVSAHQMIDMAGVERGDRQRGTTQMVTNRMRDFCSARGVAYMRTPEYVNPAKPHRFPHALACEWLLGETRGLEMIRNQIAKAKARKSRTARVAGQTALMLVPPAP